ncbi:hypothetical protein E4U59_002442 [Claviceps monticola]|nr:hypothetical protein E4U59_002442 [Claviceps monticola]
MSSHNVARPRHPRTKEQREHEIQKIQQYKDLEQRLRQRTTNSLYDRTTFHLSSKLLRINPENYTIWNVRRYCLSSFILSSVNRSAKLEQFVNHELPSSQAAGQQRDVTRETEGSSSIQTTATGNSTRGDEEIIRSELKFTIPLLMEFPKCYWLWKYRSWILMQAVERLSAVVSRTVWEEELGLVGMMLHRDRRNFHAWDYRRHVVAQLEASKLGGTSMTEAEFAFTTDMIKWDLSNFSAWHTRSQLIPRLLDERDADAGARKAFLEQELATVHEALNVGPEDQSLWYYHRYLIHAILGAHGQGLIVRDFSTRNRQKYLEEEVAFIKDLLEDYVDVKWIYEALVEYTLTASTLTNDWHRQTSQSLMSVWLKKLRELDTNRTGRWDELEKQIKVD